LLALFLFSSARSADAQSERCQRIVSLAPSVTETLFALGLGKNVVGVTRFCRYPPEANALPKVGGFYDVALEAIWSLKPSLVVSLQEGSDLSNQAEQLGFSFLRIDHRSIKGIKKSLVELGEMCGASPEAATALRQMQEVESAVASRLKGAPRYRVLVVAGRLQEGSSTSSLFISGADGYYSDVLELIGAENVNQKATVAVPTLSSEGVLALNPDVIVEIVNVDDSFSHENIKRYWSAFPTVTAVKTDRIFALSDDFASIPGVRYPRLVQELARRIYPERFVD
jgi:iron complex transport system substrate-binding protein